MRFKTYSSRKSFLLPKAFFTTTLRFSLSLITVLSAASYATADCGCDYVVPANKHEINGSSLGIKAGDVICLKAGTNYQNLKFVNLIGSASQPIIIKNCGGQININTSATFAIKVNASKHFRITGSGTSTQYGIVLRGAKSLGLSLGEKSTDFEVDRLEIHTIGFAGIMAKTDPACGKNNDRSKFTMKNIEIHDNYIHDTHGEGIYVGNSFYAKGINTSCGRLFPHAIHNAKIYNNTVKRTGWDGIQIGSATQGCEVYNNTVEEYGKRREPIHGNGIQLGEGTGGKCYNNVIRNGFASGIIVLGKGDNVIFNNLLINNGGHGSFIDARPPATTGKGFKFFNNTIVNPGEDGVRIYATQSGLNNQVKNNIIVGGNTPVKLLHNGVTNTEVDKNFITKTVSQVQFVNHSKGDYRLKSSSPCVNKGSNLYGSSVSFDKDKKSRPRSGAFEQGAYTLSGPSTAPSAPNKAPTVSAGSDHKLTLPTNKVVITARGSDSDGSIVSYKWVKESGPSSIKLSNSTNAKVSVSQLVAGEYQLKVTVKDNKGSYASDKVKIVVKSSQKKNPPPSGSNGLSYSYYEGNWNELPDFSRLSAKKSGKVKNFDLSPRRKDAYFGFRFAGYINIKRAGTYTFYTKSDDGSRLYIGENRVVSNNGLHAARERSGSLYLKAGKHPIKVIFFEKTGQEILEVRYAGPGVSKQRIPSSVLYPAEGNGKKNQNPAPAQNKSSVVTVYAGSDKSANTSTSPLVLNGRASGPNPFREYKWSKVSGPSVKMSSQHTANLKLSSLKSGTYVFRFKATDSKGNTKSDDVKLVASNNARMATKDTKLGIGGGDESTTFQVNAYPNEVRDILHVAISSEEDEALTMQIVDVSGRILHERSVATSQGAQKMSLNIRRHVTTPGLFYLVVTRSSGEKQTHRLIRK